MTPTQTHLAIIWLSENRSKSVRFVCEPHADPYQNREYLEEKRLLDGVVRVEMFQRLGERTFEKG